MSLDKTARKRINATIAIIVVAIILLATSIIKPECIDQTLLYILCLILLGIGILVITVTKEKANE